MLVKINAEQLIVEEDCIVEDIESIEEFAEEELPESSPRFIVYS